MPSSPSPFCSPADSSSSRRVLLSGPSILLPAPVVVPARLAHPATPLSSSLAYTASQATETMLLLSAAAWRVASGIRRQSSSPSALTCLTIAPPCRVPSAAGRASLMNAAPRRLSRPAASGHWVRLTHPPILPRASAVDPASACHLRPSPPVSAACRVSESCQARVPSAVAPPLSHGVAPLRPFHAHPASPQRRRPCPSPAAPAEVTSPRDSLPHGLRGALACWAARRAGALSSGAHWRAGLRGALARLAAVHAGALGCGARWRARLRGALARLAAGRAGALGCGARWRA
ncbi:unnamed protein product [Closterium sp. Naga37s-1]|nr:unnamed protein product [Closterium sp. Naga37s-1]